MEDSWLKRKRAFIDRLEREIAVGRVDKDIIPLLRAINSLNEYYTTSSCSGRIQVVASELPGEKGLMRTLAKWHEPVEVVVIERVIRESAEPNLWFSVQPPILHIMCRSLEAAFKMLYVARSSGFKRAGIQGGKKGRYPVEIIGTERIEAPLRLHEVDIVPIERLPLLVEAANRLLLRSKERLKRLLLSVKGMKK